MGEPVVIQGSIAQLVIFTLWVICFVYTFFKMYRDDRIHTKHQKIRMELYKKQLEANELVDKMIQHKKDTGYSIPSNMIDEYTKINEQIKKKYEELETVK